MTVLKEEEFDQIDAHYILDCNEEENNEICLETNFNLKSTSCGGKRAWKFTASWENGDSGNLMAIKGNMILFSGQDKGHAASFHHEEN